MKRVLRISFFIFYIIYSSNVFAQNYLTADIRLKADSILRIYLGDTVLSKYCVYDVDTYYEYEDTRGKKHWEALNKFKNTKGRFVKVEMRWRLIIPYHKCAAYDTIKGMTSIVLDSLLNPTEKPYLAFIPDFYWSNDSCHLINKEEALRIAKQQHLKPAIDNLKATIEYDIKTKTFYWEVSQTLSSKKDGFNHDHGWAEIIRIDAKTAAVKSHQTVPFGPVY